MRAPGGSYFDRQLQLPGTPGDRIRAMQRRETAGEDPARQLACRAQGTRADTHRQKRE
jgi:hypothetical protein